MDKVSLETKIQLYKEIAGLTADICQQIESKYEPSILLRKLNYTLEANFEEVWEMLNTPKELLDPEDEEPEKEDDQDKQEEDDQEKKEEEAQLDVKILFYQNVLGSISNRLLNEMSVQNQEYLDEIQLFFKIMIAKYFARDTCCKELLQKVAALFHTNFALHQRALPDHANDQNFKHNYTLSNHYKRVCSEYQWRHNELKPGMQIDLVKACQVKEILQKCWSRATVLYVGLPQQDDSKDMLDGDEDLEDSSMIIDIRYYKDRDGHTVRFQLDDWRIAPLGTFTDDFEWRDNIQVGDNIDCQDDVQDWYKSTVIEKKNSVNQAGEEIQQIYVGFRTYHEEGSKTDEQGHAFFGWSERYDAWHAVTDLQVQRFHSFHLQYRKVENQNRQYERGDNEDKEDIMVSNSKITSFAFPRYKMFARSHVISDAIDEFGQSGGFDRLLELMLSANRGEATMRMDHLISIQCFISRSQPIWHRQFAVKFMDAYVETTLESLCYVNKEVTDSNKNNIILGPLQADDFAAGDVENMIDNLVKPTWSRVYTIEHMNRTECIYRLKIGAALLSIKNLKKRIQGIKYINEAIKSVRQGYQPHRGITCKQFIVILREIKVMELLFGEDTHYQLVHRSQEIIRLLFNEQQIKESEIDMIWSVCIKQGQQIKLEVYKIILDVLRAAYTTMTDQTKEHFIDKIVEMQPSLLIEKDIEIIIEMGKKSSESASLKAAKLLWSIAVQEKNYPANIIQIARKKFCDQIHARHDDAKEQYIAQCLDNISNKLLPLQNLKIAMKLIERMNQSNYMGNLRTRQDFSLDLVTTQAFDEMIIEDLDDYMTHANQQFKSGELTMDNRVSAEMGDNHPFTHVKNIKSRLKRLKSLLIYSKTKLRSAQMEKIWVILVEKSQVKECDQNIFFNWFKNLLGAEQNRLLPEDLMVDLFRKKIVHCDLNMLKTLRVNGLECIVRLFVLVNELQGNVTNLDTTVGSTWNYYQSDHNNSSGGQDNNNQNQSKFSKFSINVLPSELEGIKVLWTVLGTCDTGNTSLFYMVQRTLINIYSNFSNELQASGPEINDSFIQECLTCVQNLISDSKQKTEKEKRESLKCISQMITTFFEGTELNGIGEMRIHRQIEETPFLSKITVENKLPQKKGVDANFIEIDTYANMTVWEFKKLVAKYTNTSPLCISLKRQDTKKPEIKDFRNCKLLEDLKFVDEEKLTVTKASITEVRKAVLLDKDDNLVPEFRCIVSQWFETYSETLTRDQILEIGQNGPAYLTPLTDKEIEAIPETMRVMTRECCAAFAASITSLANIDAANERVTGLFAKYSREVGNGWLMVESELHKFYREQAKNKEDVVRQNLNNQGIGADLKPIVDQNCLTLESDARVVKDASILPRSKLSQNHELFEQLFEQIEKVSGEEAEGLWNLLMSLQTNEKIEKRILQNDNINELLCLDKEETQISMHRVLYCLQIIQSLVFEYKQRQTGKVTVHTETLKSNGGGAVGAAQEEQQSMAVETYDSNFPALDKMDSEKTDQDQDSSQKRIQEEVSDHDAGDVGDAVVIGGAIPLPYNGPFLPGNEQQSPNYDVPKAPTSQASAIGAPNNANTNQQSQAKSTNDFETTKVMHLLNTGTVSDEIKEARKQWLPTFLAEGGLEKLIQLLKKLTQSHFSGEHSEVEASVQVAREKIAKRCLGQVMEIIKVLLICSFCSNENNLGLALELQRKVSSCSNQPEQVKQGTQKVQASSNNSDAKKNKLKEEQENTQMEMQPLIEMLKTTDDVTIQLELTAGLSNFQADLLKIIADFLWKKETKTEDRGIFAQGLSIWMSCIASNPTMLNELYSNFEELEKVTAKGEKVDKSHNTTLLFASILIEKGLVSTDYKCRESFANAIRFIVESISCLTLKEPPLQFFLKLLLSKLDYVQFKAVSRHAKLYFQLLKELLPMYFMGLEGKSVLKNNELFDSGTLLRDLIHRLGTYEPTEKRSSFLEDFTLIGFIEMIQIIIAKRPDCINETEIAELTKMILERCLFSFKFEPIEEHITQYVFLEPIEKKKINKCHAKESVQAAYGLLLTICKSNRIPGLTLKILEEYWMRQVSSVDKPQRPGFAPSSDGRSWNGFCGIKNLGAVCYMNSMLQQFYNVPTLRYCLMACDDKVAADLQQHEGKDIDDNVLHQLMNMFGFLQLSDRQYCRPTSFCFSFKSFDGQPTNVREQKDAQEFLNLAFDRIETQLKKTSQKYLLENVFGGKTCSMMKCKNCGNIRQNKEVFYNLSLEVKNQTSVHNGLKKFVSGEIISDYQCEACNQRVELEKKVTIDKLPNTLIIHLQRIIFDFDTLRNQKLNDRVEFPNVLNVKEFMTQEVLKKDEAISKLERKKCDHHQAKQEDGKDDTEVNQQIKEMQIDSAGVPDADDAPISDEDENAAQSKCDEDYEFKLVGVVCHMGLAEAGHYLSYINTERERENNDTLANKSKEEWLATEKQKWLEFNDSTVQSFNFNQIEQTCYGGNQNQNAYMLIYERRVKEKMKIVISQEIVQTLACDSTAMTSADNHLFGVFPELKQQLIDNEDGFLQYDEETKEQFALVDFDAARKFVPNSIYQEVHNDNLKFLSEKQVFSDSFYKCSLELLELVIQRSADGSEIADDQSKFELVFKIIDKLIFELLVNSSSNSALQGMTDLLIVMLSKSDQAVEYLMRLRVFAQPETLGKDEKNFFEMLCTHQDKDVREMASKTLCFALNRLMQIGGEDNMKLIDETITSILDLMPNECQKHWMLMDNYLTFLLDLVRSHIHLLRIMVEKKVVTRLMDLMTKYNPNNLLYVQTNPPLESLILTISLIVRSMPCVVDPADLEADATGDLSASTISKMNERGASSFYKPLSDLFVMEQISEQESQLFLPLDCLKSLFLHVKPFKLFYNNASKHGFSNEEYSKMLAHLCFKNKEFSRKMAKHILKGTNKSNAEEIGPFLEIMKQFLIIDDEYFDLRMEWIFGIADIIVKSPGYQSFNTSPRVGIANVDSIQTPIYRYFSPILKSASGLYSSRESALQALLSNRRSQTYAVLSSLKTILEATLADPERRIQGYLKTMEAPTYQHARYWDWIKPWVDNEVVTNTKNQNLSVYAAELELSICVKSLLEQLQEEPVIQDSEDKGDLILYPADDGGPLPYIIWELTRYENGDCQENQNEKIAVWMTKGVCEVSTSLPTGEGNYALLDAFQNNQGGQYQGMQGGTFTGTSMKGRNMGRGTANRRIGAGNMRSGRSRQQAKQGLMYQKKKQGAAQVAKNGADADSECELSEDETMEYQVKDSGENNGEFADTKPQREVHFQKDDKEQNADIDFDLGQDQNEGGQAQDSNGNTDEKMNENNASDEEMACKKLINNDQNNSDEKMEEEDECEDIQSAVIKHEDGENEKENDHEYGHYPSECLISFRVQNNSNVCKTIELIIKPKIDRDGNPLPLNFKLPKSTIPCEVYSNSNKYVVHFTKLDPQIEDWGEFEWEFRILEKNVPFVIAGTQNENQDQDDEYPPLIDANDEGNNYGSGMGADVAIGSDEKSCNVCTYLNSAYSAVCEICGSNLN